VELNQEYQVEQHIFANGIDADTGQYLTAPLTIKEFITKIRGKPEITDLFDVFSNILATIGKKDAAGLDDKEMDEISQVGWGIVFHENEDQEVIDACLPLINHRKEMVGDNRLVKVLKYVDGQTWQDWLDHHGLVPGIQDPERIPYYLLIVGSPEQIPYSFSRLLDIEYAVGRLNFEDVSGYRSYFKSLIHNETADRIDNSRDAVYFATMHQDDASTQLSSEHLVLPLVVGIPGDEVFPKVPPVAEE